MDRTDADPKGLIREAYLIEGITGGECRSILVDWALSLRPGVEPGQAAALLLQAAPAGHPMTDLLQAVGAPAPAPRRRGGWAGRRTDPQG